MKTHYPKEDNSIKRKTKNNNKKRLNSNTK